MLLAIDIGNSRVKWGWHAAGGWLDRHVANHEDFLAELAASVPDGCAPERAIVSNVAAEAAGAQAVAAIAQLWPAAHVTQFRPCAEVAGLRNCYANPAQLGADRLAAAVGARALVPDGALVIVSFGTATTIDTVSPAHEFLGGVIVPGVALMLRSLAHNTARLPLGETHPAVIDIPDRTPDAIAEGVMRAQIGAVRETHDRARARFGAARLLCTGGAAHVVAWRLPQPVLLVDNLVFDGLLRIDALRA